MDKIGIIAAKIGSLFVSTVNLLAYVACFPIDHPFLMAFIFGIAGVYLNRLVAQLQTTCKFIVSLG